MEWDGMGWDEEMVNRSLLHHLSAGIYTRELWLETEMLSAPCLVNI